MIACSPYKSLQGLYCTVRAMPKVQPPELKGFMDKRLSGELPSCIHPP